MRGVRQRKRRELSPAMLLSVLPLAVLPPGLRQQVLRLVADVTPDAVGYRARLARRAGRFGGDGFPVSVVLARGRRPGLPNVLAAAGLAVAGVLLVTGMTLAFPVRHLAAQTGLPPAGPPAGQVSGPALETSPAAPSATPAPSVPATLPASPAPPAGSPRPAPSPARTPVRTPSPKPTPTVKPGTLSVTPTSVELTTQVPGSLIYSGTFTLTAKGGPVKFVITVPAAAASGLTLSPASGSLTAGQSVTITVTTTGNGPPDFQTQLTVDPGGLTVDVLYPPRG